MVSVSTLSGSYVSTSIADSQGEIQIPEASLPVFISVNHMGYQPLQDTVKKAGSKEYSLKTASRELGEVVVTGDYRPGYQSGSVHQVDVITRDEIDRRAAVNVEDLLSQELNMRISNDPALGSSVSIQGTGGENVKILVDGVPVTGRKNGSIDLSQLNLNNIERIELVKGPMSVLYGSDALGGVINLITKKPTNNEPKAGFNGYYESVGTYNADIFAGTGIGKANFNVNAGRNFFDGWSVEDTGRWQQWKPREQIYGDFRAGLNLKRTTLSFTSSYFREEMFNKSEPVVTPYFAYAVDQKYRTWRVVQQLQAGYQLSKSSALQFSGSYSWYQYIKNTWIKDMVNLEEELTEDAMDDDTTKFKTIFGRAVYTFTPDSSAWKILAGAEFNKDNAIGERIDGTEHEITDLAIFASTDYTWKNLTLRPSVRFIENSEYDAPLVPALNLMYTSGKFIWRAGYSAGFRSPSIKELYLDFFDNGIHNVHGNPDLKAETSDNFTASGEIRTSYKNANITAGITAFYNAIIDRITLVEKDPVSGLYQYDNLDEFYSRGGEARFGVSNSRYGVEAGFAFTGTNDVMKGYEKQADIAWYPEVNAAANYTLQNTKTTFSLFWKLNGERPVYRYENDIPVKYLNESYQMLDASIRQPFFKNQLSVTAGVKNILNVTDVRAAGSGGAHTGTSDGSSPVAMGTFFFSKISLSF